MLLPVSLSAVGVVVVVNVRVVVCSRVEIRNGKRRKAEGKRQLENTNDEVKHCTVECLVRVKRIRSTKGYNMLSVRTSGRQSISAS